MALLRLLHGVNQSRHWQWALVVAHINHGLRGAASAADQRLVERTARDLGLPYAGTRLRLKKVRGGHISEAVLRRARLRALLALARRRRCIAIVLAHHADDQAETVLLRILRGCSVAGLSAMRPSRHLDGIRLVRPLLTFERAALRTYLGSIGQPWREDHTNALPLYLRNRVRHDLLPRLEAYQPAIRRVLVRLAQQARASVQAHRRAARALARRALVVKGKSAIIARAAGRRQPRLIVGMVLRSALQQLDAPLGRVDAAALARAVDALCGNKSGQQIQIGGHIALRIQRQHGLLRRTVHKRPESKSSRSR